MLIPEVHNVWFDSGNLVSYVEYTARAPVSSRRICLEEACHRAHSAAPTIARMLNIFPTGRRGSLAEFFHTLAEFFHETLALR